MMISTPSHGDRLSADNRLECLLIVTFFCPVAKCYKNNKHNARAQYSIMSLTSKVQTIHCTSYAVISTYLHRCRNMAFQRRAFRDVAWVEVSRRLLGVDSHPCRADQTPHRCRRRDEAHWTAELYCNHHSFTHTQTLQHRQTAKYKQLSNKT